MFFTIIPAKPFTEAKTRLQPVLSPTQRAALSKLLLRHTINVAHSVGPVVVISRSAEVRRLAKQRGAWTLPEHTPCLNSAVSQAITWVISRGADAALILPLDLPLLTPAHLQTLVTQGLSQRPNVVIAPCHHQQGTNALFLRPPSLIEPQFGPDSFARHRTAAQQQGLTPIIYQPNELAHDLDTPADWQHLVAGQMQRFTAPTNPPSPRLSYNPTTQPTA